VVHRRARDDGAFCGALAQDRCPTVLILDVFPHSVGFRVRRLPAPEPSRHPVDVGARTEAIILAELVRRGYRVLLPFGTNQRYDLVRELDDTFVRVQCKTGRLRNGCVVFNAQSIRSNTERAIRRDYKGEIELFVVCCAETRRLYAVPIEDATRTQGTLRIDPPGNCQQKRVRWARDYELPA
jgi:hypothetical protein